MKILCVDDDGNVLRALKRMLQMAGYETLTASSAQEGMNILMKDSDIPLVISDYHMPQVNGVSFLRDIQSTWPEKGRFLLTGFAGEQDVKKAAVDGVIHQLIDKPWGDEELLTCIANKLGPGATNNF
mgnify:CR=1 FL=1